MRKEFIAIMLCLGFIMAGYFGNVIWHDSNVLAQEPNEPHKIVFPKGTKLPVRYKCPAHGETDKLLTIEIEGTKAIYCKKCAMLFTIKLLDLNLPKLEVVK